MSELSDEDLVLILQSLEALCDRGVLKIQEALAVGHLYEKIKKITKLRKDNKPLISSAVVKSNTPRKMEKIEENISNT